MVVKYNIRRKKDFLLIKRSGMTQEQASETSKALGIPAIYVENWNDIDSKSIAQIEEMVKEAKKKPKGFKWTGWVKAINQSPSVTYAKM